MKYWDASAVVPLLVRQTKTESLLHRIDEDRDVVTWWGTPVECCSAVQRLVREGLLDSASQAAAERRLGELRRGWSEVAPTDAVRHAAERLLRVHALRAADALQLAAALACCGHVPERVAVLSLDVRLTEAARREGFVVLDA